MFKLSKWFAVPALALALAGSAFAQGPIVIKFSHVVAVDTPKGKASCRTHRPARGRPRR